MVSCEELGKTCPTCGDEFKSCRGVKAHHTTVHGESLKGVEIECDYCGETAWKRQKKERNNHEFCSRECYNNWQSEELSGENSHAHSGGKETYTCDYCKNDFERWPSQINGERKFCSKECQNEWQSENYTGDMFPHYLGDELEVSCDYCGKSVRKSSPRLERNEHNFCSTECYGQWWGEEYSGPNHPRWVEDPDHINYGGSWPRKRRQRLEYDGYECVVCGKTNAEENVDLGRGLSVHHINKARNYIQEDGTLNEELAHRRENLITLCYECHNKWEGIPLKPL